MTKKNSRSNKPKRSSFLKSLYGGEGESDVDKPAEATPEKPSAFSGILNKLSTSLSGSPSRSSFTKPGEDYNAANDEDKTNDASFPISFSSSKSKKDSDATASSETNDAPSSTAWFVFRVVIVFSIIISFGLYFTGYLEKITAWYTNAMGPYINPLLVSIGLMNYIPRADRTTNGQKSATGTNSISQLDQNVGTAPVSTATPTPTQPVPTNTYQQPTQPTQPTRPTRPTNNIKPIPIQPNQRQTPLQNVGDSARPPATQPAKYQEEQSREQAKLKSIQQALEYAQKNQQKPAANDPNRIPGPKSGYCYIGEDRGFRSCIEVGESTKCMSGEIFPTREVCVNPRLRP
jgi:hypothetical protein